jgi:hypothetical protein
MSRIVPMYRRHKLLDLNIGEVSNHILLHSYPEKKILASPVNLCVVTNQQL